jgi:hypothetical protein
MLKKSGGLEKKSGLKEKEIGHFEKKEIVSLKKD